MEKAKLLSCIAFSFGLFLVIGALLGLFKDVVLIPQSIVSLPETADYVPDPVFNMILFTFIGLAFILVTAYILIKR